MTNNVAALRAKAETLKNLHHGPKMLVLANAWDVISARLFEDEGFLGIATTSAGIASTLGYPDGERMSLEENMEVVARIAKYVRVPVNADVESGYDHTVLGALRVAQATLEAGAVGLNLEDATGDPKRPLFELGLQVEKVVAMRETANSAGVPLVINARTDVFMLPGESRAARIAETVRRGNAYARAGADCVFIPDMGDLDGETIARLVAEIEAPVSVLAGANMPPLRELEKLGVARVSLGPRAMRAGLGLLRKIARELKQTGTYELMGRDAMSYAEVNEMLSRPTREK